MKQWKENRPEAKYICSSAYKALLLLKYFLVRPLNKSDIERLCLNNNVINEPITNETLRVILNSFKALGCEFSKPIPSNNFTYTLLNNAFALKLTENEINLLNKFRKNPFSKNDWQNILKTNSLIEKICLILNDENTIDKLKSYAPLNEINPQLIFELKKYCDNKNTIIVEYYSGKNLIEFELVAFFLKYERNRLYIWGYAPKFDDFSYLRVDKIKSAKVVKFSKDHVKRKDFVIRYKMFNLNYSLEENEVLIERNENEMIIDYRPDNKFYAIQKFLEMLTDCEIISPESFKQEFVKILKEIRGLYND